MVLWPIAHMTLLTRKSQSHAVTRVRVAAISKYAFPGERFIHYETNTTSHMLDLLLWADTLKLLNTRADHGSR